ncbi:MAG: hypothetical protein IT460_00460 [Planctomycetes bacterium]|nr:hypothetical protein [Planctomycetota bacterium]
MDLKGPMKGDGGLGIGPLRVGPFACKGRVGVRRFSVAGRVDAAWLEKAVGDLVAKDTGP